VKTIRRIALGAAASALVLTSSGIPAALAQSAAQPALVDLVNPLMGTDSSYRLSYGNTYPAVAVPFGMNSWTPVTGEPGSGWGYTYDAEKINGIKQTHQPSPWMNDYAAFALMA
jgi:putative alpha-1,2-mannosidase